jgi:hypothetical protein
LSDKKGYHGSLPVPSVAPYAACVQWRRAPALALRGKSRASQTGAAIEPANLVNENGAPEEIRTPDPQIRSLVLYPAELRARRVVAIGSN